MKIAGYVGNVRTSLDAAHSRQILLSSDWKRFCYNLLFGVDSVGTKQTEILYNMVAVVLGTWLFSQFFCLPFKLNFTAVM